MSTKKHSVDLHLFNPRGDQGILTRQPVLSIQDRPHRIGFYFAHATNLLGFYQLMSDPFSGNRSSPSLLGTSLLVLGAIGICSSMFEGSALPTKNPRPSLAGEPGSFVSGGLPLRLSRLPTANVKAATRMHYGRLRV